MAGNSASAEGFKAAADKALAMGDVRAASTLLRSAVALAPEKLDLILALAGCQRALGESAESLATVEAALRLDPNFFAALLMRGSILEASGKGREATASYGAALAILPPDLDEATRRAVTRARAFLDDRGPEPESDRLARQARLAKGWDRPETWVVRGQALQGLGDFDRAEAAFREAIRRRPSHAEAHAALAQLIWMRTGDRSSALRTMDEALVRYPDDPALCLAKARFLEYAGDPDEAYAVLGSALAVDGDNPTLNVAAANLLVARDPERALAHAERAIIVAPLVGRTALCQAMLALGRADDALLIAEALCRDWPDYQLPIALKGTAWRMLEDSRYLELFDYDRLVRRATIEAPPDWSSLSAYLVDLGSSLKALHRLRAHPIGQSIRQGTQTGQNLMMSDDPVINAFLGAVVAPVCDYVEHVRRTPDVVGRRATSEFRFAGVWSTLLRPGGHHVNHVHAHGWISSAFHVHAPAAVDRGQQAWLKFGEPAFPTTPALTADHVMKPQAGDVILFPSYMWHGTNPFDGDEPRLAAAFDVLPR